MVKVVFTYYPYAVYYNHGCAVLSALCREKGIESYIVPLNEEFDKTLHAVKPDYVCFSYVTEHEYKPSLPFIQMVKNHNIPTLAGGVYARRGLPMPEFDYVCRGEGEILPDFFLNGDTRVFDEKYHCEDIDIFPDYYNVTGDEFGRGSEFLMGKKIIPYVSSRGCPFQCAFCLTHEQSKDIRIKSTIREDMKRLNEMYQPDLIHIMDELPPYYSKVWRDQMSGNPYPFFSFIRADIKKDELQFMIDSGLSTCSFWVEVGDEEYRNKVLKKGVTDADIWRTVEILDYHKIPYISFFMTGMEPEEVKWKTFDMAESIGGEAIIWEYENLRSELWAQ